MSNPARASHGDWDAHWNRYAESARENPAQQMRHEMIARLLRDRRRPKSSGAARFATKLFRVLFHANLFDSPLG